MPEVHLEQLLGRRVVDADGVPVGRIEEMLTEWDGHECRVREIHLGPAALLERLAVSAAVLPFLGPLGRRGRGWRLPWRRVDLSDPERPRLTCRIDELR